MADSDIVKQADVIYAAKGKISISELAEQMGCTVRHVHRRFVEELGVSPKRFARIVRIRETVRKCWSIRADMSRIIWMTWDILTRRISRESLSGIQG